MKNIVFLYLLLVSYLMPSLAYAVSDADFKALCRYDNKCKKIKNADGSFVNPPPELLLTVKTLRGPIQEAARSFGVDPRAVAGAILAENSMNIINDEATHEFAELYLQTNGFADGVSKVLRGKGFSVGLGQITADSAKEVEPKLAQMDNRPQRSSDEILKILLQPLEAIKYASAIISKCQEDYKKQGIDVSQNIGALVTLYNLGSCESKAAQAKASKTPPKSNFFGFFVEHHLEGIGTLLSSNSDEAGIAKSAFKKIGYGSAQYREDIGSSSPSLPKRSRRSRRRV